MKFCMGKRVESHKILLDSCVWIALYDPNDRQHKKAVDLFKKIEKEDPTILVHRLVVIETLSILKYQRILGDDLKEIRMSLVDKRRDCCVGGLLEEFKNEEWKMLEEDNKVGLVDTLLLSYCRDNGLELISFDKALMKTWGELKRRN